MEGDDQRRSFSQVVIGFSEEQSEALRDQDESFYGYSSDSSESEDSSDSSDTAERSLCFLNVSAEDLKAARKLMEELDKASCQIFISGKLDRGETLQHASAARRAATSRARVSYRYEVNQTKVCLAVFLFAYSVSRHELHTV